jgi:hypothetical protein
LPLARYLDKGNRCVALTNQDDIPGLHRVAEVIIDSRVFVEVQADERGFNQYVGNLFRF